METILEKGGSAGFDVSAAGEQLCAEFLDKADEALQHTVREGIRARLPPGRLHRSVGSMGPARPPVAARA